MHELTLTQSIVDTIAERLADRQVIRVRLAIGRLSGVVVDSVRFCFDIIADGTPLAGAELDVDEPPGQARCRTCPAEFNTTDPIVLCPECGSADVDVLSGQDVRIVSVEVSPVCAPAAAAPTRPESG